MKNYRLGIIIFCIVFVNLPHKVATAKQPFKPEKPQLQHATHYHEVSDISHYFVSEKLDGVRGYWNGHQLFTRQGNTINTPAWFTKNWPTTPLDGELWLSRDQFQALLSCVSKKRAEQNQALSCWKDVRFMIFDLPSYQGPFHQRVLKMKSLSKKTQSPYLAMIPQKKYNRMADVDKRLVTLIAAHGEGLMLHHENALYKAGRSASLMKLKKYQDDEAIVIGYTAGKGKYLGQLGALKVKTKDNITFKIGSGFSDNQRANPPKIGTTITFKYNGLTQAGIPRFARFWRVKTVD